MKVPVFEIFKIYFIIGVQLIGGGYVILPLLKKYLVEEKNYLKDEELIDYLALSQCLPGIIALNISIFSGYALNRLKGAIAAVFGLILPSFIIILLLAGVISEFSGNQIVQNAFFGVRISIVVLLFHMIYDIFKKSDKNGFFIFLYFSVFLAVIFTPLSPAALVVISVFAALIWNKKWA